MLKNYLKIAVRNLFRFKAHSLPAAFYLMDLWLEDFTSRISITFSPFIISALIAVLPAMLTISVRAIKTASANPVTSLKYE